MKTGIFFRFAMNMVLAISFFLVGWAGDVQAKRETHQFTLYTAQDYTDPYTLIFPITVTRPGEIRVYGKVYSSDKKRKTPIIASIVKVTHSKKHPRQSKAQVKYDSNRESFIVRHAVDSVELKGGARYEILVANFSTQRRATGEILITYPVAGEADEGAVPRKADLAITGLGRDSNCQVQMTITNKGPGRLAPVYWTRDIPSVRLYRNGRSWGGANLKVIDPQQKLSNVGGTAVYRSNLKISGKETIKAQIQMAPRVPDANQANNTMERSMTCTPALPDLGIRALKLVDNCKVQVLIQNKGMNEPPETVWQKQSSPTVFLYKNGRSWGGSSLWQIDPDRRLKRPGAMIAYTSNLKVNGTQRIKVMLDSQNVLQESNENNNILERQLTCNQ